MIEIANRVEAQYNMREENYQNFQSRSPIRLRRVSSGTTMLRKMWLWGRRLGRKFRKRNKCKLQICGKSISQSF